MRQASSCSVAPVQHQHTGIVVGVAVSFRSYTADAPIIRVEKPSPLKAAPSEGQYMLACRTVAKRDALEGGPGAVGSRGACHVDHKLSGQTNSKGKSWVGGCS